MKRKRLSAVVLGALIITVFIFGASWVAGGRLSASANWPVAPLPDDLHGKEVQFPSESGSTLHGWFVPGTKGAGAIVLMHGVRSDRTHMLERARFLNHAGYTVLLFDFQGHGESPGKQITFGYLESKDARAAVGLLRALAPSEKIGVIGASMGGAAALLASPPLEVDAMILEMVYPTIEEAIGDRLALRFGGWSRLLTPLLTWQLRPRLGVGPNDLRPIERAATLNTPKLFIAGSEDRHTTLAESRQLFDAAREPKEFWEVSDAGHIDLYSFGRSEYEQHVLEFFGKYLVARKA